MSAAQATVDGLLNIKPMITLEDGTVVFIAMKNIVRNISMKCAITLEFHS
ncbi:hypothetical protein [Tepidibacillus decaturensis]